MGKNSWFMTKKCYKREKYYIKDLPSAFPVTTYKKLKKPLEKKSLLFPEMELSSSNIKKSFSYIFPEESCSYISGNGTF